MTEGAECHSDSLLLLHTRYKTIEWPSFRFVRGPYTPSRSGLLEGGRQRLLVPLLEYGSEHGIRKTGPKFSDQLVLQNNVQCRYFLADSGPRSLPWMRRHSQTDIPSYYSMSKKQRARFLKFDLILPPEKKVEFLHL